MAGFTIGSTKSSVRESVANDAEVDKALKKAETHTKLDPPPDVESDPVMRVKLVDDDFPFDESQLEAIDGLASSRYGCLTGAAGTGKTTVTKGLVDRLLSTTAIGDVNLAGYWSADQGAADEDDDYELDEEHVVVPSVAMAAYTGRASQQVKKNFPTEWHNNIMTIHRLLGFVPEYYEEWDAESDKFKTKMRFVPTYNENYKLPWDIILIDEAGMLGLDLWHQLLAACKPGCRIYMIGDINQLPPIYGKSIFGFAMAKWPAFELKKVHRQEGENNPIVDNAWRVIHGIKPETEGIFKMMEIPVDSQKASQLVRGVARKLNQLNAYKPLRDVVITPIHGINPGPGAPLGDYPLNESFSHMFNDEYEHPRFIIDGGRERKLFAVGDKVMATKNDWNSGITNGMTGYITEIFENPGYTGSRMHYGQVSEVNERFANGLNTDGEDVDLDDLDDMVADLAAESKGKKKEKEQRDRGPSSHTVVVRFGDGDAGFDKPFFTIAEVGTLQLAYVVTCHKMQGGEAPTVLIILHESHSRSLSREWLYTAITRASKNCILLYTDRGLRIALNRQVIAGATLREKILSFQRIMDPAGDGTGTAGILLPVDPDSTLPTILEKDIGSDLAARDMERRLVSGNSESGLAKLIARQKRVADKQEQPAESEDKTEVHIHVTKITIKGSSRAESSQSTDATVPEQAPDKDGGEISATRIRLPVRDGDNVRDSDAPVDALALPAPTRYVPQVGAARTVRWLNELRDAPLMLPKPAVSKETRVTLGMLFAKRGK